MRGMPRAYSGRASRPFLLLVTLIVLAAGLPVAATAQRGGTPMWVDRISASHTPGRELADPLTLNVSVHVTSRSGSISGATVSILIVGPANERIPARAMTGRDGFARVTARAPGGGPYEVVVRDIHYGSYFYDPRLDTHAFPGYFIPPVGTVYVSTQTAADLHSFRQYTSEGAFVRQWFESVAAPVAFFGDSNLATDAAGYVYTHTAALNLDTGLPESCEIHKYTAYGALVDAFGTCGNDPGEFFSIADLAVDSAGNLYVLKDDAVEQGSVEVFDSDGNYLSTWTVPFRVSESSMGFDLNDDLYISSSESDEIHKFSQSGVPLLSWLAPRPREIAVDSSNLVYVTDAEGDRVRIFTPTGQFVAAWLAGAGGENVKSIAISADDSIYLTDSFFHVQQPSPFAAKYTVNGDFLLAWDASGLGVIFDIAVYR